MNITTIGIDLANDKGMKGMGSNFVFCLISKTQTLSLTPFLALFP